ncbi:hypothetical protein G6O69_38765, partial [Pseudenhygromyxa sp. WMMC2535]|uniref:hypothetical protein n=1 Tax=Pseudenhygromyxa sp. WMMC2535 TaxID=2712867 RepID=UPI001595D741
SYPWGAHQRTASSYQVYAEYARRPGRVLRREGACPVLRWRHLVRGAEERRLGLVVVHLAQLLGLRGSVATWKMYANSAKSCAGTADRDNMRFTGTASQRIPLLQNDLRQVDGRCQ